MDVTTTPLKVVATMDNTQIHPAGCGGIQSGGTMYINSGGGWPIAPLSYDIYALDISNLPTSISAKLISQRDDTFADSHGMASVGRYVWSVDRAGNNIEIIDTLSNLSVSSVDLVTSANADPAPDLLDVAPDGQYVFVGLRGPNPLTGNDKNVNNAKGTIPGVGVIQVDAGGKIGHYKGQAAITNRKDGKETADPHGIAVRKKLSAIKLLRKVRVLRRIYLTVPPWGWQKSRVQPVAEIRLVSPLIALAPNVNPPRYRGLTARKSFANSLTCGSIILDITVPIWFLPTVPIERTLHVSNG